MDSDKSEQNVRRRTEWGFHFSHLFVKIDIFCDRNECGIKVEDLYWVR